MTHKNALGSEQKSGQKIEQKTAIVTGASRGIGHAVAERFRSLGWRVITVSRSPIPGGCPRSQEHNTHFCMDQIGRAHV